MTIQFKAGDLVKLKISHQHMTIKGFATQPSSQGTILIKDRFECVWYDGMKQQKAVFHKDALEWLAPYHDTLHFANYE
ncbi:MAG TPA: DUF2158 domain-containing protein [Chitinophagaceae bacterium]|nr:DUF2158 domain-containing protein [Chitinophagaceae bacterium]